MNCPNCGKEINKNQKFCKNCGCEIPKEPTPLEKALKYCFNHWQKVLLVSITTASLFIIITIVGSKLYNSVQINNAMNKNFDGQKILVQNVRKEKLNGAYDFLCKKLEDKYHGDVYISKIYNDKTIIYADSNINSNDIISYLSTPILEFKKQRNNSWISTDMNEKYIKKAEVTTDYSGEWVISLEFTKEGKGKFAQLTKEQVGKQLAIFFDNELITAPKINEPITSGSVLISGGNGFTYEEAEKMVQILSIELDLKILEVK